MQRSRGLPAASESFSYQIVLYRHLDHQVLRALEHPLLLCINDIYNIISYKNECQKSPFTKGENDKIIQVHLETLSKCTSFSLPSSNT
jgi:L-ribulose-5-phosphate 3-epimerase UlaE